MWKDFEKDVQVMAGHIQASDKRWLVKDADWKSQVYLNNNKIYLSNYIDNAEKLWTITFFYKGKEIGRATWHFGKSNVWSIPRDYTGDFATEPTVQFKAQAEQVIERELPKAQDFDGKANIMVTLENVDGSAVPQWIQLERPSSVKNMLRFTPKKAQQGLDY